MVIALIRPAIKIATLVYKHRKSIYTVLTAQDRYIDKAMKAGRYGRQARYGVRSGALAGSIIGSVINNADDSPGNGISKPFQKQPKTNKPYKTRPRQTSRYRSRSVECYEPGYRNRYPYSRRS